MEDRMTSQYRAVTSWFHSRGRHCCSFSRVSKQISYRETMSMLNLRKEWSLSFGRARKESSHPKSHQLPPHSRNAAPPTRSLLTYHPVYPIQSPSPPKTDPESIDEWHRYLHSLLQLQSVCGSLRRNRPANRLLVVGDLR